MQVIESSSQEKTQYLLMNYGWNGDFDQGHYSILNYSTNWAEGFNNDKRIYYNLTTGQLN